METTIDHNNKIDINNLSLGVLTARLFNIQREYIRKDILIQGEEVFNEYILNVVRKNFQYEVKVEQTLCNHLGLFLLGNDNNCFNKLLNNH